MKQNVFHYKYYKYLCSAKPVCKHKLFTTSNTENGIMITKKLQDAINEQINAELWSAYLYLSMSMDAENKGLKGVANWMYVQWLEEQDHARILSEYLNSQNAHVQLKPIAKVQTMWKDIDEMFRDTLRHEQEVTKSIHELTILAWHEKDLPTISRLQWFIDEQVEEENSAQDIIDDIEQVGSDGIGLYLLDTQLAERSYHKADALQ